MARGSGSSILFGEFGEGTTDKLKFSNLGISSFHRPSFLFIWPLLCPIRYVRCEFYVDCMLFAEFEMLKK